MAMALGTEAANQSPEKNGNTFSYLGNAKEKS